MHPARKVFMAGGPGLVFETWVLRISEAPQDTNSSDNKSVQFRRRLSEGCWAHVRTGPPPRVRSGLLSPAR